ncbi:hypothetical protein BP00DRAFT_412780 [Aspergillus indologenus CBS 114.80]|uniref:Uncharacterized protein n=1 Tax=Aspergillus indologenus CBS 114.80 TaxID=1450541 RepID=A0A2V5ID09_9EURO|nr:hypothetical protein BP00DRAFT_412780 [Aspergillus indologenus CBS 114.80]
MVLQVRFTHQLIVNVRTLLDNWIVLELRVNDWRGGPRVICLQCEEGEGKQSTAPEQDGITCSSHCVFSFPLPFPYRSFRASDVIGVIEGCPARDRALLVMRAISVGLTARPPRVWARACPERERHTDITGVIQMRVEPTKSFSRKLLPGKLLPSNSTEPSSNGQCAKQWSIDPNDGLASWLVGLIDARGGDFRPISTRIFTVLVVSPSVIGIIQQGFTYPEVYHPPRLPYRVAACHRPIEQQYKFAKESREEAAETCLVLTPLLLRDSPVSSCLQYLGIRRLEEPLLPSFPLL